MTMYNDVINHFRLFSGNFRSLKAYLVPYLGGKNTYFHEFRLYSQYKRHQITSNGVPTSLGSTPEPVGRTTPYLQNIEH